ncbi:unnamed protein product [Prorocentrum cordatum]|uniref:Uncharacterized protein n=1 Tax=Prorocentrum cordatum TaxID=2364126 RepID=A0ABN9QMA2_9DINO|nr:unnamed protein product [Polarella glacialis]
MYLTVPESQTDIRRLAQMKEEVIRYLPENRWGVRIIPGVVPELWPEGRYDRVFKYGQMLPKRRFPRKERPLVLGGAEAGMRANCTWVYKDEGGLYDHFYDAAPGARTLEACKEHCCHEARCNAIPGPRERAPTRACSSSLFWGPGPLRFSPSAADGPELQCLLYPRGVAAWSLERPLYEDYRVHLLDHADLAPEEEGRGTSTDPREGEEDEGEEQDGEEAEMPWWEVRNLNMARVTSEGRHPQDHDAWPAHHCGCSLGPAAFSMWMEALHRGVQNLIVFESDGFPSCVQSWHSSSSWHRRQRQRLRGPRGFPAVEGPRGLAPHRPGQGRVRGRARRGPGGRGAAGQRRRTPGVPPAPVEGQGGRWGRRLHGQQALPRVVPPRHPRARLQHGGRLDRVPLQPRAKQPQPDQLLQLCGRRPRGQARVSSPAAFFTCCLSIIGSDSSCVVRVCACLLMASPQLCFLFLGMHVVMPIFAHSLGRLQQR